MTMSIFDSQEAAEAEIERLTHPDNARELGTLISSTLHAFIAQNFYTNVTCAACPYPDACTKTVRLLDYGALPFGLVIFESANGFEIAVTSNASLELPMSCTACDLKLGH